MTHLRLQHSLLCAAFVCSALSLAPSTVSAQQARDAERGKTQKQGSSSEMALQSAIQRLASSDFDTRRAAAKEIKARGKPALAALRVALEKSDDPELRWQARRLIRQLERGQAARNTRDAQAASGLKHVKKGSSSPRRRKGSGSEDLWGFPGRGFGGLDFPGLDPDFAKRLRRELDEAFRRADVFRQTPGSSQDPLAGSGLQRSSRLRVEADDQGVRVEEQIVENGKTKRREYKAKDIPSLLRAYPNLRGRIGLGAGRFPLGLSDFGRSPFDGSFMRDFERLRRRMDELSARLQGQPDSGRIDHWTSPKTRKAPATPPQAAETPEAPKGPRLGIYVRDEIPQAVREYLDLPEAKGLWIVKVVDGSLAAKAGLQAGDILTAISGQAIGSAQDVSKALAKGEHWKLEYIRKGVPKHVKLSR